MDTLTLTRQIQSDLESLWPFNATPGNGTTRLPFTKEAREAADHIKLLMEEAGLSSREDAAGNVIGTLAGSDPSLPAVVVGSHYDTVINGGNFDGAAGVIVGIALARMIRDRGISLTRDFVVIAFCDEEGMRFTSGYFGSRAWLGQVPKEDLHTYKDKDGISIYRAMQQYGLDPEALPSAKMDAARVKAFIEMHIEQGPVLEREGKEVGLVECIVGIRRYMVTLSGRPDHAGTTPMDMRRDAVEAAAKVIAQIPDFAREKDDGSVATTGYIHVSPCGMNIVAEQVEFSIDLRSRNEQSLAELTARIEQALTQVCEKTRTSFKMEEKLMTAPVNMSQTMLGILEESCKQRGYSYRRMVSGAGHDSHAIGPFLDTVMIFSPSRDGRSHCPEEWTNYEDIAKAASVAYDLVLALQD